ncbi:hypothetical protein AURANDRAFT_61668 [Aureococcus anophagefferens]|uniref:WW domain-containing protein n=1 Tax=Aureococcus anophagefferens TaxID=44056 RepID=F0Y0X9_AURAN|nr:hypothetical protein AURANDRAFT_61668 [Aureococcus anophagefferens]EGB11662.1 hypothetical protein AURANDRAFT_61668 [Aureococcus anophagefferens]|eukprot:XP_009034006.1 hypothetical protein AURANDRAFT_61668 [Aureococcus anophagefferens]
MGAGPALGALILALALPGCWGCVAFSERIITTLADGAVSVFAIDVDGDGDVDALSASYNDDTVAWYENDGSQSFTKRIITNSATSAVSVFAIDVDGDGDVDALSSGSTVAAWYENDGSQSFTEHTISAGAARSVFAIDLDGDGDVDALSASYTDDTVAWYDNDGSQYFTERFITTLADGAVSIFAIDVDGDGDVDVLSASEDDDTFAWYESDEVEDDNFHFYEHVITTLAEGARSIFAIDVDGDGDTDALAASYSESDVAWYESDEVEDDNFHFYERLLSASADGPMAVFAIDVDGDGDVDALSAAYSCNCVVLYENDGSQSYRVRAQLVVTGAGSLANAALLLAVVAEAAPTPRRAFLCVALGQRAVELALAATAAFLGLKVDASSGLSGAARRARASVRRRVSAVAKAVRRSTKPLRKPPAPPSAKVVEFNAIYARSAGRFARESPIPRASPDPRASGPGPSPPPFDLRNSPPADGAASEGLPAGWESAYDAASQCFYYRSPALGVSQWERPAPNRRASAGAALRKTPSADGAALHSPRRGSV